MLTCRPANTGDCEFLFDLRNDANVIKFSTSGAPVSLDDHQNWFNRRLDDNNTLLLIIESDGTPVAQVRFDLEEARAILNYALIPQYRGRKLAAPILRSSIGRLRESRPEISELLAMVLPANIASRRVFERLGFSLRELDSTPSLCCYHTNIQKNIQLQS